MKHKKLIELYVLLLSRGNPRKRAALYKKMNVFHSIGEHCLYQPTTLPSEPNLVSIGNNVNIETKGYGHGAGMSQWGAQAMALEGKKCEDIIKHYYTDVEIEEYEK